MDNRTKRLSARANAISMADPLLSNRHVHDQDSIVVEYEVHPSSVADARLRTLRTTLIRWINNEIAAKSLVVRNLSDEMADGHVMATFLACLTGDQSVTQGLQAVSSDRGKSRNWEYIAAWLEANLKLRAPTGDDAKWSFQGIVKHDQSSILLLLMETAARTGCPFAFPPNVSIAVVRHEKIGDTTKQRTQLYQLTGERTDAAAQGRMAVKIQNSSDASLGAANAKRANVRDVFPAGEPVPETTEDAEAEPAADVTNAPNRQARATAMPHLISNVYLEDASGVDRLIASTNDLDIAAPKAAAAGSSDAIAVAAADEGPDAFDKLALYPDKLARVTALVTAFVNRCFAPINIAVGQPTDASEAQRLALPAADPRSQLPPGAAELTDDFHDGVFFLLLLGILGNFYVPLNQFKLETMAGYDEVIDGSLTLADKLENVRLVMSLMSELRIDVRRLQPADIVRKDFKSILRCLHVMSNHFSA